MMIAFTGMDGSGKSLQAQALVRAFRQEEISARYIWSRWSPSFLRPFMSMARWLLGRKGRSDDEQYQSFLQSKRRMSDRAVFVFLWKNLTLMDYWFQILFKIIVHRRRNRVIVCDRYLTDLLVDLSNNFGYGEEQIVRLCTSRLLALFPKPDHTFLLDLPAEVAFQRKEDVPLPYLQDRRKLYLMFGRIQGMEVVDAAAEIPQIQQAILSKSLKILQRGE